MLRAGAAASNIAPPLGIRMFGYFHERTARDVHDDLFAKSLVLDDGETKLAIVVCDLIGVSRAYLDKAKELINERCGIFSLKRGHFLHSHSCGSGNSGHELRRNSHSEDR